MFFEFSVLALCSALPPLSHPPRCTGSMFSFLGFFRFSWNWKFHENVIPLFSLLALAQICRTFSLKIQNICQKFKIFTYMQTHQRKLTAWLNFLKKYTNFHETVSQSLLLQSSFISWQARGNRNEGTIALGMRIWIRAENVTEFHEKSKNIGT